MIVTIYPSECILFKGDYVCSRWIEHRFIHRETTRQLTDTGFIKVRNEMPAILVNVPLAKLTQDGRRLTLSSGFDTDPGTVLLMARIGKYGMKVLPKDPQPSTEERIDGQDASKA